MASGERVKVWFKEIENNLASRWHGAITCEELRALALDLTVKMRRFRDQSGIESPIYYCPSCKKYERAGPPTIHGGSVLFAARRLGLIDDSKLSELKRLWDAYAERQRRTKARQTTHGVSKEQNRGYSARAGTSNASCAPCDLRLT